MAARKQTDDGQFRLSLEQQFEVEGRKLLRASARYGIVEAIMRLRALTELSDALPTEALFELTLRVVEDETTPDPTQRTFRPSISTAHRDEPLS